MIHMEYYLIVSAIILKLIFMKVLKKRLNISKVCKEL